MKSYTYSLIRFRPDLISGESINVGVVLLSRDARQISVRMQPRLGHVSKLWPSLRIRFAEKYLKRLAGDLTVQSLLSYDDLFGSEEFKSSCDFVSRVLPKDSSSVFFDFGGCGVTVDIEAEADILMESLVRNVKVVKRSRKDDAAVWTGIKRHFDERGVTRYLTGFSVQGKLDQMHFDHAWQNGKWHCLKPMSFDYLNGNDIREKARSWAGNWSALIEASEDFTPYLILSRPSSESLLEPYNQVKSLLTEIPGPNGKKAEVLEEDDAATLAERFKGMISEHQRHSDRISML